MARLTPILLGLTFVIAVVALWLVLMLFITKPWDPDEFAANANPTVVTEATPKPFQHGRLLSNIQVENILESYINNDTLRDDRGNECLWWTYGTARLQDPVTWRYMNDNSDRWIVTAAGNSYDGVQIWYIDDNTRKVIL